jgi:hypothetical protein
VCRNEIAVSDINGSFQLNSLPAKNEQLKRGYNGKGDGGPKQIFGEPSQMLIVRRLLLFAFSFGCGLLLFIIGRQNFYNDRRLKSSEIGISRERSFAISSKG